MFSDLCSFALGFFYFFSHLYLFLLKENVPWAFWVNMVTINKKKQQGVGKRTSEHFLPEEIHLAHAYMRWPKLRCPLGPESHPLYVFGDFAPIPCHLCIFNLSPFSGSFSLSLYHPQISRFLIVPQNAILFLGFFSLEAQLHCLFSCGLYNPHLPAPWFPSQNSSLLTLNMCRSYF